MLGVPFFTSVVVYQTVPSDFWDLALHFLNLKHQIMELVYTWNGFYLYSILAFPFHIFVALVIVCCNGLCYCYHTEQLKYHQQCQTHVVSPQIFHIFSLQNILPIAAMQNGTFLYLYLPNCHGDIIKYDFCKTFSPLSCFIYAKVSVANVSYSCSHCSSSLNNFVEHRLYILLVPDMSYCLLYPAMKINHQNNQSL